MQEPNLDGTLLAPSPASSATGLFDLPEPILTDIITALLTTSPTHEDGGGLRGACKALLAASKRLAALLSQALARVPTLTLDQACHAWATDACLAFIALDCQRLTSLHLRFCSRISAHGVLALSHGPAAHTLHTLRLSNCGDVGCGSCLQGLTHLRELDLTWAFNVTSVGLHPVLGRLHKLSLQGCELVDDGVCRQLPNIRDLNLAYTRVTDDGLAALANRSPHLSRLTLARRQYNVFTSACTSEAGERGFCRTRPDVQLLHIS